jgi:hypothetical protein
LLLLLLLRNCIVLSIATEEEIKKYNDNLIKEKNIHNISDEEDRYYLVQWIKDEDKKEKLINSTSNKNKTQKKQNFENDDDNKTGIVFSSNFREDHWIGRNVFEFKNGIKTPCKVISRIQQQYKVRYESGIVEYCHISILEDNVTFLSISIVLFVVANFLLKEFVHKLRSHS